MSSFSGLNTASTALWAQRRGLDVTGHNIANVNTEGYSRQRVDLEAMGGSAVPAFHSVSSGTGQGVSVEQVIRIRDAFLESRAHTESARSAQLTVESTAFEQVEQAFREPGSTGIQRLMDDVSNSWGNVADHPTDLAARSQLLQDLDTFADGVYATRSTLDGQWTQSRQNLGVLVDQVNADATEVASLNRAIQRATRAELPTNELADRRDALVLDLAKATGATVRPREDGVLDVVLGGVTLVAGSTATRLVADGPASLDDMAATGVQPRLVTTPGGTQVTVGGTAGGQLTVLTDVVPRQRDALDDVAARYVADTNALHATGYDRAGEQPGDLLAIDPVSKRIVLDADITGPDRIAAARTGPVDPATTPPTGPSTDNEVADAISQLRLAPDGAAVRYRAMIVELGVQASVSSRNLEIQDVVTTNVDAARESVAGVNLDEEMSNMLQFQHAYSAAARMVSAVDEALDVLINRTGLVGR
ncbi:flagellar hook-associated protein FlgK [Geodermatophilus sp. DSM 44513]|uniref:flagellar hook-associated protein FlgK n=1 Tax=Geodermatophilus sp. DSM 44513 TaxID=1528104 RepID=UPI001279FC0F|nr:flagellar hook-associated protein FlgK [Geodermatophilus sp. DSM 44513]WNV76477.1 flagellar hook-associated protein FlgK [Geodermatophilus sp. DSM 44513]